ncbi:MAG: EF-hand domain-containing protein [Pseudomonadota bacterium]
MKTARNAVMLPVILAIAATSSVPAFAQDATPETPPAEGRQSPADTNADGQVTWGEMEAYRTERFNQADTDGDGQLSAEELAARADTRRSERAERRIQRMIEARDANGDGVLSAEELAGDRTVASLFAELDADGDGVLAVEEFAQLPVPREMRERGGKHRHGNGHRGGDRAEQAPAPQVE